MFGYVAEREGWSEGLVNACVLHTLNRARNVFGKFAQKYRTLDCPLDKYTLPVVLIGRAANESHHAELVQRPRDRRLFEIQ